MGKTIMPRNKTFFASELRLKNCYNGSTIIYIYINPLISMRDMIDIKVTLGLY